MTASVRRLRKLPIPAAIASTFAAASLLVPGLALAGPTGGVVVSGGVSIGHPSATGTVIKETTHSAIINWQQFNIGGNEYVQFIQPSSSSVVLNRIIGGSPSEIFGSLSANGRIFLINPAGIMFAPGAQLDVGSLFASTLDIKDRDFLAGRYVFASAGGPGASVTNAGSIKTADGGFVVLAGDYVKNTGIVQARLGQVVLASGAQVTMDLNDSGLVSFAVDKATLVQHAGADNAGQLVADGGRVVMTAKTARDLVSSAVNNSGLIRAQGIANHGGEIELTASGGDIADSGTLDASNAGGAGGKIDVRGDANIDLQDGAQVLASGSTTGGTVHIVADGTLTTRAGSVIQATGASGKGGYTELSGHGKLTMRGDVKLGKGGTLLLDPTNLTIADGSGSASSATVYEKAIEAQLKSATNVQLVASNSITMNALTDHVLDGSNNNTGGSLLLGIGSINPASGQFVRGTGGGAINFVNKGDAILVDGALDLESGSGSGTIDVGNLTGGALTLKAGGAITAGNVASTGTAGQFALLDIESQASGDVNLASVFAGSEGIVSTAKGNIVISGTIPNTTDSIEGANTSINAGGNINIGNVDLSFGGSNSPFNATATGAIATGSIKAGSINLQSGGTFGSGSLAGFGIHTGDLTSTGFGAPDSIYVDAAAGNIHIGAITAHNLVNNSYGGSAIVNLTATSGGVDVGGAIDVLSQTQQAALNIKAGQDIHLHSTVSVVGGGGSGSHQPNYGSSFATASLLAKGNVQVDGAITVTAKAFHSHSSSAYGSISMARGYAHLNIGSSSGSAPASVTLGGGVTVSGESRALLSVYSKGAVSVAGTVAVTATGGSNHSIRSRSGSSSSAVNRTSGKASFYANGTSVMLQGGVAVQGVESATASVHAANSVTISGPATVTATGASSQSKYTNKSSSGSSMRSLGDASLYVGTTSSRTGSVTLGPVSVSGVGRAEASINAGNSIDIIGPLTVTASRSTDRSTRHYTSSSAGVMVSHTDTTIDDGERDTASVSINANNGSGTTIPDTSTVSTGNITVSGPNVNVAVTGGTLAVGRVTATAGANGSSDGGSGAYYRKTTQAGSSTPVVLAESDFGTALVSLTADGAQAAGTTGIRSGAISVSGPAAQLTIQTRNGIQVGSAESLGGLSVTGLGYYINGDANLLPAFSPPAASPVQGFLPPGSTSPLPPPVLLDNGTTKWGTARLQIGGIGSSGSSSPKAGAVSVFGGISVAGVGEAQLNIDANSLNAGNVSVTAAAGSLHGTHTSNIYCNSSACKSFGNSSGIDGYSVTRSYSDGAGGAATYGKAGANITLGSGDASLSKLTVRGASDAEAEFEGGHNITVTGDILVANYLPAQTAPALFDEQVSFTPFGTTPPPALGPAHTHIVGGKTTFGVGFTGSGGAMPPTGTFSAASLELDGYGFVGAGVFASGVSLGSVTLNQLAGSYFSNDPTLIPSDVSNVTLASPGGAAILLQTTNPTASPVQAGSISINAAGTVVLDVNAALSGDFSLNASSISAAVPGAAFDAKAPLEDGVPNSFNTKTHTPDFVGSGLVLQSARNVTLDFNQFSTLPTLYVNASGAVGIDGAGSSLNVGSAVALTGGSISISNVTSFSAPSFHITGTDSSGAIAVTSSGLFANFGKSITLTGAGGVTLSRSQLSAAGGTITVAANSGALAASNTNLVGNVVDLSASSNLSLTNTSIGAASYGGAGATSISLTAGSGDVSLTNSVLLGQTQTLSAGRNLMLSTSTLAGSASGSAFGAAGTEKMTAGGSVTVAGSRLYGHNLQVSGGTGASFDAATSLNFDTQIDIAGGTGATVLGANLTTPGTISLIGGSVSTQDLNGATVSVTSTVGGISFRNIKASGGSGGTTDNPLPPVMLRAANGITGGSSVGGVHANGNIDAYGMYVQATAGNITLGNLDIGKGTLTLLSSTNASGAFQTVGDINYAGLGYHGSGVLNFFSSNDAFTFNFGNITLSAAALSMSFSGNANVHIGNVSTPGNVDIGTGTGALTFGNISGDNVTVTAGHDLSFAGQTLVAAGKLTVDVTGNLSIGNPEASPTLLYGQNVALTGSTGLETSNATVSGSPSLSATSIMLDSGGNITLSNSSFHATGSTNIASGGLLSLSGDTMDPAVLKLTGASGITDVGSTLTGGAVTLDATGGAVNLTGTTLNGNSLVIDATTGIAIDSSSSLVSATTMDIESTGGATSILAALSAPGAITVKGGTVSTAALTGSSLDVVASAGNLTTGALSSGHNVILSAAHGAVKVNGQLTLGTAGDGALSITGVSVTTADIANQGPLDINGPGNDMAITATAGNIVTGNISSQPGQSTEYLTLSATGGSITTQNVTVEGLIANATGNISLGGLNLQSLTPSSPGPSTITSTGGNVGIGGSVQSNHGLTVTANAGTVTTESIAVNGALTLAGQAVNTQGNSLSASSVTVNSTTGALSVGGVTSAGNVALTTTTGALSFGDIHGDNVSIATNHDLSFFGQTLVAAGTLNIDATGALNIGSTAKSTGLYGHNVSISGGTGLAISNAIVAGSTDGGIANNIMLASQGDMALSNSSFFANGSTEAASTAGSLTLTGVSMDPATLTLTGATGLSVSGSTLKGGTLTLTATGGSANISGSTLDGSSITITGGNGVSIASTTLANSSDGVGLPAATIKVDAGTGNAGISASTLVGTTTEISGTSVSIDSSNLVTGGGTTGGSITLAAGSGTLDITSSSLLGGTIDATAGGAASLSNSGVFGHSVTIGGGNGLSIANSTVGGSSYGGTPAASLTLGGGTGTVAIGHSALAGTTTDIAGAGISLDNSTVTGGGANAGSVTLTASTGTLSITNSSSVLGNSITASAGGAAMLTNSGLFGHSISLTGGNGLTVSGALVGGGSSNGGVLAAGSLTLGGGTGSVALLNTKLGGDTVAVSAGANVSLDNVLLSAGGNTPAGVVTLAAGNAGTLSINQSSVLGSSIDASGGAGISITKSLVGTPPAAARAGAIAKQGGIAGVTLKSAAGNVQVANSSIDGSQISISGKNIHFADGSVLTGGAVVFTASGLLDAGGTASTINADALSARANTINLSVANLVVGTGIAQFGSDPALLQALRAKAPTLLPASSGPNASFYAPGGVTLGSISLAGGYLFVQAPALLLSSITGNGNIFVDFLPIDPTAPLNLNLLAPPAGITTLVFGGTPQTGNIFIGDGKKTFNLTGGTNLVFASGGKTFYPDAISSNAQVVVLGDVVDRNTVTAADLPLTQSDYTSDQQDQGVLGYPPDPGNVNSDGVNDANRGFIDLQTSQQPALSCGTGGS